MGNLKIQVTLRKLADGTELGGVGDAPGSCVATQKDFNRADRYLMKPNMEKCNVPYLGRNNPMQPYMLGSPS